MTNTNKNFSGKPGFGAKWSRFGHLWALCPWNSDFTIWQLGNKVIRFAGSLIKLEALISHCIPRLRRRIQIKDWTADPWTNGGPTATPRPGSMVHFYAIRETCGRIHFASAEAATRHVRHMYTVGRPLIHDVLFCFLSEVPVTNCSCSISPTASGTCQQHLTKHREWGDAPQCTKISPKFIYTIDFQVDRKYIRGHRGRAMRRHRGCRRVATSSFICAGLHTSKEKTNFEPRYYITNIRLG